MRNILVTIDFDKNARLLIKKAIELATKFNSRIWLLHIVAPDPEFVGYGIGPQYIRDYRAKDIRTEHRLLQKYSNELEDKGINSDSLLIQGPTIEMIISKSKKLDIDLIIAGHHEHGFLYNAFVGSVSAEIIKKSKIPVLIVPF